MQKDTLKNGSGASFCIGRTILEVRAFKNPFSVRRV